MNIRLGIYEIFSRIVPGGLYIVVISQLLVILGLVNLDPAAINSLSLVTSIAFIVVAYILGGAFDRLALVWFRLFKKRGISARSFKEFKTRYQDRWNIDFREDDWPLLLAFIRTKSLELAGEIDRHNALSIMLRNVSLGLAFLAVNSLIQFFISWSPNHIIACVIILVVAILNGQESVKFRRFFYDGIFETIIAYRLDLEKTVKPVRSKSKRARSEVRDE